MKLAPSECIVVMHLDPKEQWPWKKVVPHIKGGFVLVKRVR